MPITAKVIADSHGGNGQRVTTLELFYPRFIHAEFMTHRVFSRNASSSRAIPVKTVIASVDAYPTKPETWFKNQKGMQPSPEVIDNPTAADALWDEALLAAIKAADGLADLGVHKQWANRLLEPFAHIRVIVTATDWENFFELRMGGAAQSEIRQLATAMLEAINTSKPEHLQDGMWHRPYVTQGDVKDVNEWAATEWALGKVQHRYKTYDWYVTCLLNQLSVARCARVSYRLHDGRDPMVQDDLRLAEQLLADKHMSPFEHQATPCRCGDHHANLFRFFSYRSLLEEIEREERRVAQAEKSIIDVQEWAAAHGFEVTGLSGPYGRA